MAIVCQVKLHNEVMALRDAADVREFEHRIAEDKKEEVTFFKSLSAQNKPLCFVFSNMLKRMTITWCFIA